MKNTSTPKIVFFLLIFLSPFLLHAQNAGHIDTTFHIGTGVNGYVKSIAIQSDGKIIIGGSFTKFNGDTTNHLARLNADGTLDNTFNIGTGANDIIYSIAIQADGKIIIGGDFISFNGVATKYVARLNADGSLDNTFNIGTGTNTGIFSVAVQADYKIIIGGPFYQLNGAFIGHLVRLNPDGTLDNTFNMGTGASADVQSIIIQEDGKIIIGGGLTSFNGVVVNHLARLNADGTLDNNFNTGSSANSNLASIAIQDDGKIIIGGVFTTFNGVSRSKVARINPDGTLDKTFNIGTGANNEVTSVSIQADGKIIVGGAFSSFNGVSKNCLARLNVNGTLDNTFNSALSLGFMDKVLSTTIQTNGKIIIGHNGSGSIHRLWGDPVYYNTIRGNIYTDSNLDCNFQFAENPVPSALVKALPGPYYGGSNAYGKFRVRVDSGTVNYSLTQENNSIYSQLFINQCATSQSISLKGSAIDTASFDFADSIRPCVLLNISVQKLRARSCFRNSTYVNYVNYGYTTATGTVVTIEYPSDFIPISSVPMWSSKQGSVLTFNLGNLEAGASGKITITDSVSCIAGITGLTECIKASISPASNCTLVNPAWDKSSMKVTGDCQSGTAHFIITNNGTGNMGSSLEYRVYENDTLIYTGTYQLNSGESFTVDYPGHGQTIRLEADQPQYHPGKSHPRATIENCGVASPEVRNLVTTAPQDDFDEETAITCNVILNSHDPNLKQAVPSGIGAAHNVTAGEEIEYVIHFQNTGSDTAYTVTVVDTLDAELDVASFTQGASSYPYTLGITGKGQAVLSFRFDNINLPDSITNNLASSGLVSFRITVPSSAPIGTVIKNKAYIYFDYNAPVITNETMHTVDNTVATNLSKGSLVAIGAITTSLINKRNNLAVKIYPNPTNGLVTVEMPESAQSLEMRVYSVVGVLQKSVMLDKLTSQQVNLESIPEGLYLYEILQNGERKAGGMLKIK